MANMDQQDRALRCAVCDEPFIFSAGEQQLLRVDSFRRRIVTPRAACRQRFVHRRHVSASELDEVAEVSVHDLERLLEPLLGHRLGVELVAFEAQRREGNRVQRADGARLQNKRARRQRRTLQHERRARCGDVEFERIVRR